MNNPRSWFLAGLAWLACSLAALAQTPPRIPVEDFFAESDYLSMKVSPDGKFLAFLTTLGTGKVGIALMDLGTGKVDALVAATDENISAYFWKGNDYIVYGGDIGGAEQPAWRSIRIQPEKNGKRKVVAISEAYDETRVQDANFLQLRDTLRFDPYRFLAWGRKNVNDWHVANYLVDVRDGKRTPVVGDSQKDNDRLSDVTEVVADNTGALRARTRYEGKNIVFEVRPTATGLYTKVAEFPSDNPKWEFRFFAADNETLYIINREQSDTGVLHALDVPTRKLGPPLFGSPDGEIGTVLTSYDRRTLYGVAYTTDRNHCHFFHPARAQLQAQLDQSLPGMENIIVSSSQDEKIHVIASVSDRDPGTYYVLDLRRGSMGAIGKINRRINPAVMRPMQPIQYQARDGLTIHGYLTLPAGSEGKKVPLIINPHGGPFGIRDDWGFNGEVQFLANRGYGVLQINYRGSGGYGTEFQRAGRKEWGGKMQDDLTDGVKWAIAQGIADPKRVAIYGASYGGYAALAGVTFTPELYCCAVNYVGVSDLSILQRWGNLGGRDQAEFLRDWVGSTDRAYVQERSPLNFVERISVPTLHAYGFNDPRVHIDHWKRLEPKLKQFNKPYEIMIMGNEGHGFDNENNRISFYRRLETFLEKHLAPATSVNIRDLKVLELPAKQP